MADPSIIELERAWKERCQTGNFSPAIMGLGTIRVMGKAGDAPVQFPRITSLAALDMLEPDEQWALRTAQDIVTQAQQTRRQVLATVPPQSGEQPTPTPVTTFDPRVETILVTSMTIGG